MRFIIKCLISIVLSLIIIVVVFFTYVLWGMSPLGYISEQIGFYPIISWPITYTDYDPESFREADTLYVFHLSRLDQRRLEAYLKSKPDWNLLPLSDEAKECELIKMHQNDQFIDRILAAEHGRWFWDRYRRLYIYDLDKGDLMFRYSTKINHP